MTFVKQGVVLPLGGEGQFDDVDLLGGGVIVRSGVAWLYYSAFDGANQRVGLALSRDGFRFVKMGAVIPLGSAGEFDDVRAYFCCPVVWHGLTWLYYTGYDGASDRVGLALSRDGFRFVKVGVVLPVGGAGSSDDLATYSVSAVLYRGCVLLYYGAHDGGTYRIALAASRDGFQFVKLGVVLTLGASGSSDDVFLYTPSVVVRDGKVWLYYSGFDGGARRVQVAVSEDGIRFVKLGVVVPVGAGGEFDDSFLYAPGVVVNERHIFLYYAGYDGASRRVGLAISRRGV